MTPRSRSGSGAGRRVSALKAAPKPETTLPSTGREASEYAWTRVRPSFLDALAEGEPVAIAFLNHWLVPAKTGLEGLLAKDAMHRMDRFDAVETFQNLRLLRDWWIPSRSPATADSAAEVLRLAIVSAIEMHRDAFLRLVDEPEANYQSQFTEGLRAHSAALGRSSEDPDFTSRVAFRLVTFDPRISAVGPDEALANAVQHTLRAAVRPDGSLPGETARTVAQEVKRRLHLDEGDPAKVQLVRAIESLEVQHRQVLYAFFGPGGSTVKGRTLMGAGGFKSDRLRLAALTALTYALPELAQLPLKSASHVQAKARSAAKKKGGAAAK